MAYANYLLGPSSHTLQDETTGLYAVQNTRCRTRLSIPNYTISILNRNPLSYPIIPTCIFSSVYEDYPGDRRWICSNCARD